MSWGEFSIGLGVRKARMLGRTLKCLTGICGTEGAQCHSRHMSLLPEVREMAAFRYREISFISS